MNAPVSVARSASSKTAFAAVTAATEIQRPVSMILEEKDEEA